MNGWQALDRFLQTDPQDVGCEQAMEVLDIYVDVVTAHGADAAERRYPGVAAHLRSCGPCGDDFAGLLAAISGPASLPGVGGTPVAVRTGMAPGTSKNLARSSSLPVGSGSCPGGCCAKPRRGVPHRQPGSWPCRSPLR